MTWNKNIPTGASKIRTLPATLQAQWEAIEDGEVPFEQIYLHVQSGDPTAVANHSFLYTKNNTNNDLYYRDNNSNIVQMTSDGLLGVTTANINTLGFVFDTSGYQHTQDSLVSAFGFVASDGTLNSAKSYGIASSAFLGTGNYRITFTTAMADANYIIVVSTASGSANGLPSGTTACSIGTKDFSGNLANMAFSFMVLGGRL